MAAGLSISFGGTGTSERPRENGVSSTKSNGTKRTHASLGDDSDEDGGPTKQVVTHFGVKGAVNAIAPKVEKGPLVIKPQANRDWREASKIARAEKRAKYGLPPEDEVKDTKAQEEEIRKIEESRKPVWGLNVKGADDAGSTKGTGETGTARGIDDRAEQVVAKPKTDDEKAMDALMGIKHKSDLTIPAADEEQAFQRDYKEAPDMATLEQYAAVPVEEFGAALLRGMGWKEGFGIGKQKGRKLEKAKMVERRPALLGIGAKEDAAVKEEMGAWGRGAKRSDQVYNPVVMRNKRTGEELTEQELKEKVEAEAVKQQEADLDALATKRIEEDREKRKQEERRRRDDYGDRQAERHGKDGRRERERERDGDHSDRRDRRRSKDRDQSRRDRDYDSRGDKDRRRDHDDRDARDKRRHRDEDYRRDRDRRRNDRDDRDDDYRKRRH